MSEYEVGSRILIRMVAALILVPSLIGLPYALATEQSLLTSSIAVIVSLVVMVVLHRWPRHAMLTIVVTDMILLVVLTPLLGGLEGPIPAAWPIPILLAVFASDRRLVWGVLVVAVLHLGTAYGFQVAGVASWTLDRPYDRVSTLLSVCITIAFVGSGMYRHQRALMVQAREHEARAMEALQERDAELTRREALEVQLQQTAAEAEAANQAKSAFLASMSHELRTPLNAIIGYAEILVEELDETDHTEDCQRIRSSGRHLLTLINDVLDLSKIEAGRMELCRSDVEVTDLLRDLQDTLEVMVDERGNSLTVDVEDVGRLHTDGVRVRQVLLNLLSNAAKFTENGEIALRVARETRDGRAVVVFEVQDTGIGIDEAAMGRLFRPFVQADGSTSRRFGGTGLGLVLARHFAEMLEGEVLAESTPGVGSTFTLLLPCSTAASELAALAGPRLEEARRTDRPVVVCVDDEPGALLLLDRLLIAEGFHPVLCADPRTAVDRIVELRPAFVTLDLRMPGMNGSEVLDMLRLDLEVGDTPVLFCTIAGEGLVADSPITRTIQKPVDRSRLAEGLDQLLSRPGPQRRRLA